MPWAQLQAATLRAAASVLLLRHTGSANDAIASSTLVDGTAITRRPRNVGVIRLPLTPMAIRARQLVSRLMPSAIGVMLEAIAMVVSAIRRTHSRRTSSKQAI